MNGVLVGSAVWKGGGYILRRRPGSGLGGGGKGWMFVQGYIYRVARMMMDGEKGHRAGSKKLSLSERERASK